MGVDHGINRQTRPAAYHLLTLVFEQGLASKVIISTVPAQWVKSWAPGQGQEAPPLGEDALAS
jgi:hypothetical protein